VDAGGGMPTRDDSSTWASGDAGATVARAGGEEQVTQNVKPVEAM